MYICALTSAAPLGYLAGPFSFRVKSRWCPKCGELTTTPPPPAADGRRSPGRPNV
ncbi:MULTISPECIES: hypothetical protein [unclassified Micromonospora]|uniref:hypothetical protein n=1 Tax=unclassified Micromonospora TaxID=2617518 RepID=UPI003A878573